MVNECERWTLLGYFCILPVFAVEKMKKRYQHIELLAPAKNLAVGCAAIDAGADAVYIGGPSFGARKAAGNSLEDIAALCRYAHFFRAKVLVTLNTLLYAHEYEEAVRLAYAYKQIGVDAIIIQDLKLASMLFETGDFSGEDGGIRLHASTQCDNRTLARVKELEAMGFRRVVLARELSIEEMADIRRHTTVELEAFVHGALCVSYSGACYMSERLCGRSANRGECAQMCRLLYDVLDEQQEEMLHQKHILSLYDLDRSALLSDMLEAGITTFKIEGRLKDADYVKNIVGYYRLMLDRLCEKASVGKVRLGFTPAPNKTFHRGSTTYFSNGRPASLVNMLTPKSTGEYIGKAPIPAGLLPEVELHNGDGLCFGNEGFYWPLSKHAGVRIPAGTALYRNLDVDFQRQLSAKDAAVRLLPVSLRFEETDDGFLLTVAADETVAELRVQAAKEPASNANRAEAMVRQQLCKLGGTRLEAEAVEVVWQQPYFLSASVLNDWRRQLVERFLQKREEQYGNTKDVHWANAEACLSGPSSDKQDALKNAHAYAEKAHDHQTENPPEMTCKYCILYEMGRCKKQVNSDGRVPAFLRQGQHLFRIVTHCKECYMTLHLIR